MTMNSENKFLP